LVIIGYGSSDNPMNVVNSFSDNRIKIIQHKFNQGVSQARNSALKHS